MQKLEHCSTQNFFILLSFGNFIAILLRAMPSTYFYNITFWRRAKFESVIPVAESCQIVATNL